MIRPLYEEDPYGLADEERFNRRERTYAVKVWDDLPKCWHHGFYPEDASRITTNVPFIGDMAAEPDMDDIGWEL